jgi:hypothetical protein
MPKPLNEGTLDGLRDLQRYCFENASESGFHEDGDLLADHIQELRAEGKDTLAKIIEADHGGNRLMLVAGEPFEAHEELRSSHPMGEHYYNDLPGKEGKPEGVPSELADTLIRVLDTAGEYGIDLAQIVQEKLAYNSTRGYRHGGRAF